MLLVSSTEVGARADAGDPHLPHMALNRLTVHLQPFPVQYRRDAAGAIEGAFGVDLVDTPLESQLVLRGLHGLIVQAGAVQTEQLGLSLHRQLRVMEVNQRKAFFPSQLGCLFFPAKLTE